MNRNKYIMRLMAFVLLISSSCSDFLDEKPQTAFTREDVFSDLDKIEPLVIGLYTKWRDVRKDRGGFYFMLGTDESQQGAYQVNTEASQAGLDRYNAFLAPSNNALAQQWASRWAVIANAAETIYALKSNKQDPERNKLLLGDASFIRACLSFEVAQYWGEIPIMDFDKLSEYGSARQPLSLVYAFIISDLETAIQHLPEEQSDKRRGTKAAAYAMLGKVYLYAQEESGLRNYEKAKENFEAVINSGKHSLLSDYSKLWDGLNENSVESIYSFQFNNIHPDNNQIQWQMGSRSVANLDGNAYFGGYDLMVPTKYAYSTVDEGGVWEEGDLRQDESVRYDFVYNGNTPTVDGWMGGDEMDPHVKKYEDKRIDGVQSFWYSGKNVFFLRYSDILLNYAEALNELDRTSDAVVQVNKVRERAWGGTLPSDKQWNSSMSKTEFRTKILDERMRELCFEGWRRMDLNRTGKLVELVSERNKWAKESGTIQQFHRFYPIPREEMLQNVEAEQNEGYSNN